MTTDIFNGVVAYTIAGTGPYAIPHEYTAGAIRPQIVIDGREVPLAASAYTVTPASGPSGNLTLTSAAAATHAGRQLIVDRATILEQGWIARPNRHEQGVEAQLDRLTQGLQDVSDDMRRTLRMTTAVPAVDLGNVSDVALIWRDGYLQPGPTTDEIANAQDFALVAQEARDEARDWADIAAQSALSNDVTFASLIPDDGSNVQNEITAAFDAEGSLGIEKSFEVNGLFKVSDKIRTSGLIPNKNLLPYSEDFSNFFEPTWTYTGLQVDRNTTKGPLYSVGNHADTLIEDAANSQHLLQVSANFVAGESYALSIYAKHSGRLLALELPSALFSEAKIYRFDLSTGTAVGGTTGLSRAVETLAGGWYRIRISALCEQTGTGDVRILLHDGSSFTYQGDGASGAIVFGAQLEIGEMGGTYWKTPDVFGPINRQTWWSRNPWSSKFYSDDNAEILSIRNSSGFTLEGVGFTHNIEPSALSTSPVDETTSVINTVSVMPSKDVNLRNLVFHNVSGTCVNAFGVGTERWKLIGSTAIELGLALIYSAAGAKNHIVAFNHVMNSGDATIVFNGDTTNSLAIGNHMEDRGERHVLSGGAGGGGFVTQGNYNGYVANQIVNSGGAFVQIMNGNATGGGATRPTGNFYTANVFDGTQFRQDQQDTFALFILRPSNDGLNAISNNMIRGAADIDCIHTRATSHSSTDDGGDWIFENNVVRDMRHVAYLHAGGGNRLIIRGNKFYDMTGNAVIKGSPNAAAWSEIILEDNVFDFGSNAVSAIVSILDDVQTVGRIVLRKNRFIGASLNNVVSLSAAVAASCSEIVDDDNQWPAGTSYPSAVVDNVGKFDLGRGIYESGFVEGRGYYKRYGDFTQECHHLVPGASGGATWLFAKAFSGDAPIITANAKTSSPRIVTYSTGLSQATLYAHTDAGAGSTIDMSAVARGNWSF